MSDTTQLSAKLKSEKQTKYAAFCTRVLRHFGLNGHFNYAFIYGTWEVIRARKVGTTHTKIDYVVYRLFYPVILIGTSLFAVIGETQLTYFFSLIEIWTLILQTAYAFVFLQNVLENNLHRDPVRGRQKIPERLIVTDELEKGGRKFFICKRYSILPTNTLYHTERVLWLMFNTIISLNLSLWLGHVFKKIDLNYHHFDDMEQFRMASMGLLSLADVLLTPIPMRLAHIIYPLAFAGVYSVFLYSLNVIHGTVLYVGIDWKNISGKTERNIFMCFLCIACMHVVLYGVSKLRDHVVSLLDDSRTPKQMQNLRSQKRLARRKLMNYIEGPDGRIIGISLEKHTRLPIDDEYIKTEENDKKDDNDSFDDEIIAAPSLEGLMAKPSPNAQHHFDPDEIPITNKLKPPPAARYNVVDTKQEFSSSSSSETDFEAIKAIHLPSPPPPKGKENKKTKDSKLKSKIPVPAYTLGLQLKPRDSKEAIHHKLSIDRQRSINSPPTPPLIKLVQQMVKIQQETKQEIVQHRQQNKSKKRNSNSKPTPDKTLDNQSYRPTVPQQNADSVPVRVNEPGLGAAAIQAPPNYISEWAERNKDVFQDFHSQLITRLQQEQNERMELGDSPANDQNGDRPAKHRNGGRRKRNGVKGILKHKDGERRHSVVKKREFKIIKRRGEKIILGKQGKPVYDPITVPTIKQSTTFHYLGAKLKGEKAEKNILNPNDLYLYKTHPGVGPFDPDPEAGVVTATSKKSVVAFHPLVKYFDVDETRQEDKPISKLKK